MKHLLALLMLCTAALWSVAATAAATAIKGEVLEVKDVDAYTYLRLKTNAGEVWAAVTKATVAKGSTVTVEEAMEMTNFESKSLKKTFAKIYFGHLPVSATDAAAMTSAHGAAAVKPAPLGDIKVTKATGAQGRTVAEVISNAASLKDKTVQVHARVVKFNPAIMDTNWLHVQDGTGSEAKGTQDLVVTTKDIAKVGDTVLLTGTVHTDKDFGSGYSYKVILEDAKLKK